MATLLRGFGHTARWSFKQSRLAAYGVKYQAERITTDGRLLTQQNTVFTASQLLPAEEGERSDQDANDSSSAIPRPPSLAAAAPVAPPVTHQQLEHLVDIIHGSKRVVVLTGAGVSTESNIPDYRGPQGAYTSGFKPMTHQQFMANPQNRARYWARSFAGWLEFSSVQANSAHEALARLQHYGWLGPLVTQNVDRLHHKAGSRDVLEIHGTTHRVVCMSCGANTCRHELQATLAQLNPEAAWSAQLMAVQRSRLASWQRALRAGTAADARAVTGADTEQVPVRRPDGDVELRDAGSSFIVPPCSSCGGILKPDVVFFGDTVPKARVLEATQLCQSADTLLVVGSSLMVFSAYRLARAAKEAGAQLVSINVGPTRADDITDYKLELLAGEVLMALASHRSMLLPRV